MDNASPMDRDRTFYTPKILETRAGSRIHLRLARDDDSHSIAYLGSKIFSASFGFSMDEKDLQMYLDEAYSLDVIEKSLSDSNTCFLVAHCNEKLVGFVQLTYGPIEPSVADQPNPVELQRIYLSPEQHGSGLAKFLVDEITDVARHLGFQFMFLGVWEQNYKAQKFYEKMGFRRFGEHDFVMGDCVQTDWILGKLL